MAFAISVTDKLEVFVARMPDGFTAASNLEKISTFSERISGAASITRSQSASSSKSSPNETRAVISSLCSWLNFPFETALASDLARLDLPASTAAADSATPTT